MATIYNIRATIGEAALQQLPYLNWYDGCSWTDTHSHPTPRDALVTPSGAANPKTWQSEKPRGSRHILDTAPFSIWNDEKKDYDYPSKEQLNWVADKYKAEVVDFMPPYFLIATNSPGLPENNGKIPLTVGCAPVVFTTKSAIDEGYTVKRRPSANAAFLLDPLAEDPIPSQQAVPWTPPTREEGQRIISALSEVCQMSAVNFIYPYLVVEIANDGKIYLQNSLPSRIGGWRLEYHLDNDNSTYWNSPVSISRIREITPNALRQDKTNYLRQTNSILGPGFRVEGRTQATTAGVKVRNGTKIRLTLAAHGF